MNLDWVDKAIEGGNYAELDRGAKLMGGGLGGATKTQLRGIFGTVKRLETLSGEDRWRELTLLRPRLAYAAARTEGLDDLKDALSRASLLAEKEPERRVQRLVDLMEAILCYATAERAPKGRS